MDTQIKFGFDAPEQQASEMNKVETDAGAGNLLQQHTMDDLSSAGEPQGPDGAEVPDSTILHRQARSPSGREDTVAEAQVSVEGISLVYESTGVTGDFELSPLAQISPLFPEELNDLADNIKILGVLEEPTLARTDGPGSPLQVMDGKRRLQACKIAGIQPTYRILRDDIDPRDYVWAKNCERRHLNPSQRALAFAEIFAFAGPGRPRRPAENCPEPDNFPSLTQGQAAKAASVSRGLISGANKVADPNGRVAPEVREAVRQGIVAISDIVEGNVSDTSKEVQVEALGLVKEQGVRTLTAAVARVKRESQASAVELHSRIPPKVQVGKSAQFYWSSVDGVRRYVAAASVDLVLVDSTRFRGRGFFSHMADLADHALRQTGVLVVVAMPNRVLQEAMVRLSDRPREVKFIIEFSMLFPVPIRELGDPHQTEIRRAALLVFGKPEARLPEGDDVIEIPAPGNSTDDDEYMDVADGLSLVVKKFATGRKKVLLPSLEHQGSAVVAALKSGCTVIGADYDEDVLEKVREHVAASMNDSSTSEPDAL